MLPLIQAEVQNKAWMSMEELVNFIAVSESTPGPFAINISTYVGMETGGILGAFCATFGIVLPSFIIILIVAKFYIAFKNNKVVAGCMSGLRPAVIGLISASVISIGQAVFFPVSFGIDIFLSYQFICSAVIFITMLMLTFKKVPPIAIIILSAVLGLITGYIK